MFKTAARPWAVVVSLAVIAMLWSRSAGAAPLTGVVYEASTGEPVEGVRLQLFYDANDTIEPNVVVPADRLAAGEQDQLSGADGSYAFDLPDGRLYRLEVTSRRDHLSFPSKIVAPLPDFPRSGEIAPNAEPRDRGARPFYTRFDATLSNARFLNNHIAVDELRDVVSLDLRADRSQASTGDVLSFSATLRNESPRALSAREGRPVLFRLSSPPGVSVNLSSARAEFQFGSSRPVLSDGRGQRLRSGSDRMIRFGPFDVPAGATLTLRYQATVGINTKEGRFVSRLVATDAGGVELTREARATVAITKDRDFSTSTIVGRAFCDENQNQKLDASESGLFGARIYSDSGAVAVSDSSGRFHFTRIQPGSHAFKIDEGSLAGGTVIGDERRLLILSEGLPAGLRFPVDCRRQWVGHEQARIVLPLAPPGDAKREAPEGPSEGELITVRGRLSPMSLSVNGQRRDLPSIDLKQEFPKTLIARPPTTTRAAVLQPVPERGYGAVMPRWSVVWTDKHIGTPARWRFTIERVELGGLAPVLHRDGAGAPPPVVEWNGLSDGDKPVDSSSTYVARLTLVSTKGVEVATRRYPFGIGVGGAADETVVVHGPLFQGERAGAKALAPVRNKVREIADRLGATGSVRIEVHGDGSGDRLKSLVQTQVEAKRVQALFVAAGVPASRISPRGRGASELVDDSGTEAARAANRRLVLTLLDVPSAGAQVPREIRGKQELRINGRLTPVRNDGGFETAVPRPQSGELTVDLLAASGRRVAYRVPTAKTNRAPDSSEVGSTRTWQIAGDLSTRKLQVDFDVVPEALWSADVRLAAATALPIPELQTEVQGGVRRLSSPMDFRLLVADTLSVARYQLVIAEDGGPIVHRESRAGSVPAVLRWDGMSDGQFALEPDTRYRYWLDVEFVDSSGLSTAPHWFSVDPARSAGLLEKSGRLFSRSGKPRASLRNALSRFAVQQRARDEERFSVVLEVAGDKPRVDAVRAELVRYLSNLGIKSSQYDLQARELTGRRDRVSIVRDTRPLQVTPEVRINSRRVALQGSSFSEELETPRGQPLIVEVTAASGAKLRYVLAKPQSGSTGTSGGELLTPTKTADTGDGDDELSDSDILASDTPARSLRVHLPAKGALLGDRKLAISGSAGGASRVKINGEAIRLDPEGNFHIITTLPVGKSELEIRADDDLGGSSTIRWPVRVARRHRVVVGLVEGIAASAYTSRGWMTEGAALAGMGRDTTLQVGPLLLSGRAQGFAKARMPGGRLADTVELTAHIDTGRERRSSAFFEQVLHPREGHTVFGDDAQEIQDVNTRGKIYARATAGESRAVIGSVRTRLEGGGDLFTYERTTDGAVAEVHRHIGGNDVAVRAFGTTSDLSSSRDINWFRATGGSLFYLRHGHVMEGSETVRIVVRDRDSGMRLDETELTQGVDYTVDYEGGRVRLREPLSATSRSAWVLDNMDSSSTPMSGHLVYLSVRYEHEDQDGLSQRARGAYASTNIESRLSVGAGIVSEERGQQESYRLLGADASLNLGEQSNLRAEVAASRARDANHFLSMDGGLSFGELQREAAFDAGANGDLHLGWKLSADLAAGDWTDGSEFADTSLSAYVQDLDSGFASGDSVLDQGRFKFGGRVQHRLSSKDMLLIRHEGQIAQLPRVGPTLADVMSNPAPSDLDERASYLTSIQWARDVDRWHYKLEGMHQRLTSTASLADGSAALDARRLGLGALTAYEYSERLTLRVGQQIIANSAEGDPVLKPISPMRSDLRRSEPLSGMVTNVGSDLALTPDVSVGADVFQRWNGDNAVQVGLRTDLSERGSMYVQEQVGGVGGRLSNATIVGAEDRFGADDGGKSYGEYRVDRGVLGNRNRALLGLGRHYQVSKSLGIGMGFEHQQAFGGFLPDGSAIGDAQRNVLHSSLAFRGGRFRVAAQVELRLDHGDSGAKVDPDVLGADPRAGQAPGGFADHGGPAPGAALVIAPGEQIQIVGGLGADLRVNDSHQWLGRVRASSSVHEAPDAAEQTLARFAELTTGWAFRPTKSDRFEILSRYSYLRERRPSGLSSLERTERSHVLAVLPFARLPRRFLLSGKLALKRTAAREVLDSSRVDTTATALLALARLGYRFYGKWDASVEERHLALVGNTDDESKFGTLLELGYSFSRQLRLGAGYNLSHFSDNELGDLERDSHGFFLRITGQF